MKQSIKPNSFHPSNLDNIKRHDRKWSDMTDAERSELEETKIVIKRPSGKVWNDTRGRPYYIDPVGDWVAPQKRGEGGVGKSTYACKPAPAKEKKNPYRWVLYAALGVLGAYLVMVFLLV